MRRIIVAITCLLSLSLQDEAHAHKHPLRGLAKIGILIEDLESNSIECELLSKTGLQGGE